MWMLPLYLHVNQKSDYYYYDEILSSACDTFIFQDNNSSKSQWIFTKLDMCIDIVEIWFGIANGQISSVFDRYLPAAR